MPFAPRAPPQDEYSILSSKHAIGIHGFVLVYSVSSRTSLEICQIIYDKIIDFCGLAEVPCVIVGAKTDLSPRYVSFHRSPPARRVRRG